METNTIIRKNTHFRCFLYHLEHSPFVDRDPQIKSPFIMVFTLSPAALNIILLLFVSIKKGQPLLASFQFVYLRFRFI